MMTFQTSNLLSELFAITVSSPETAAAMKKYNLSKLYLHPRSGAWCALQCMNHLNKYGNYYLQEIEQRIAGLPHPHSPFLKSGQIGNNFAGLMQEQYGKIKK